MIKLYSIFYLKYYFYLKLQIHQTKYILKNIYKHQILDDTPITYKIDYNYVYIQFDESVILNKNNNLDKI